MPNYDSDIRELARVNRVIVEKLARIANTSEITDEARRIACLGRVMEKCGVDDVTDARIDNYYSLLKKFGAYCIFAEIDRQTPDNQVLKTTPTEAVIYQFPKRPDAVD